jgi:hypothetical protein
MPKIAGPAIPAYIGVLRSFLEVLMRRSLVAMLCLLAPAGVGAQGASEAARAFLGAHTSGQWADMARLVDSAALVVVRAEAIRTLRMMEKVQNFRPPADTGAAAGLQRMFEGAKSLIGGNMLAVTFANVRTEQDVNALSDLELMARWFEAKGPDYMRQIGMGALESMLGSISAEARSAAEAAMPTPSIPRWDVVGEFRESDGASHVVFRLAGKTPPASTGVLTFRPAQDGKWYLTFARTDDQLAAFAGMALRTMMPSPPGG